MSARELEVGNERLGAVAWCGFGLVVVAALVRASVTFEPMPYWASDPLVTFVPQTGMGPTAGLVTDVVAALGAALCMLGTTATRGSVIEGVLLGLGAVGMGLHALVLVREPEAAAGFMQRGSLDHLLPGVTWAAGLASLVGLRRVCADPLARRLALGLLLGFVGMQAAKGVLQVTFEHGLTIAQYEAQRGETLAARGWEPGSAMAEAYERRLYQSEASGWFGLTNVLASFAAASVVGLLGCAISGWKRSRWAGLGMSVGVVVGAVTLWLTHSKGGMGAAAIGVGWGLLVWFAPGGRRVGGWLALAAAVGVIALVAGRGYLGDAIGELSLRFRAQYQVGAVGAWLDQPVLGVGPGGFREAYLLHRPELSVEEVASPHSAPFEWVATLGLLGIAWVALIARVALGLGRGTDQDKEPEGAGGPTVRSEVALMVLAALVATGASAVFERSMATGETGIARVIGLALWVSIASGVVVVARGGMPRLARVGVLAAGVTLVVHAMIEVTPGWPNAALLWGAMLGAVSAGPMARAEGGRRWFGRIAGGAGPGLVVLIGALGLGRVYSWERHLGEAAAEVRLAGEFRERLGRIGAGLAFDGDSFERVRRDLGVALGLAPAADAREFDRQLNEIIARRGNAAAGPLGVALRARPDHAETRRALGRLHLGLAQLADALGDEGGRDSAIDRAMMVADEGVERRPRSPAMWGWRGVTCEAAHRQSGRAELLVEARASFERTLALDPLSLDTAFRLMELSRELGDDQGARSWARESVRLDELKRLDPLKRLSREDRALADRVGGTD